MKISNNGIRVIKHLEGCVKTNDKHVIYDDQSGTHIDPTQPLPIGATIGYGHLIKPNENFRNGITEQQATELLYKDLSVAERAVHKNIHVPLTQNQYDALVSLTYNIGEKNFADSTVVKYINIPTFHSTKYPNLESAWKAWNRSQGHIMSGLNKRRATEW